MVDYYSKQKGNAKLSITKRGLSLHSGAVGILFERFGEKPSYLLIGYDDVDDTIYVKPVHEDRSGDAFKVGGRIEEDKYLSINSKGLVQYFKRKIDKFNKRMNTEANNTITVFGEWDDQEEALAANLTEHDVSDENNPDSGKDESSFSNE